MGLDGNAATIAQFFSSKGLSQAGVAGILGTWQAESSLNPGITNSIGAHGLAQWLGGRRSALQSFAARLGTNENNIDAQLEFAWAELQSPQYAGLLHTLQTTNDPRAAAQAFVNLYERPGPGGDASAPGNAARFYSGGIPGGSGTPSPGGAGGGTQDVGSGGGSAWWSGVLGGFGTVVGGNPGYVNNVTGGVGDIASGIAGLANDLVTFMNMVSLLFKPSFWLRVGSFALGLILLGFGFHTVRGGTQ